MTQDAAMTLGSEAIKVAVFLGAPVLVSTLVVGMLVSLFQAVTQINEATLTFIPKMIVVVLVLAVAGPWMMDLISGYTTDLFTNLPRLVR